MPVYKGKHHICKQRSNNQISNFTALFFYSTINSPRRPGSILKRPLIITLILKNLHFLLGSLFQGIFSLSCESKILVANGTIRPWKFHLIEKIRFTYQVFSVVVQKLV